MRRPRLPGTLFCLLRLSIFGNFMTSHLKSLIGLRRVSTSSIVDALHVRNRQGYSSPLQPSLR